jgi:hypothetical protein
MTWLAKASCETSKFLRGVRLLTKLLCVLPFAAILLVGSASFSTRAIDRPSSEQENSWRVMLILRGIGNAENPRGQLDDESALAYAGRLGAPNRFKGFWRN